MRKPLQNTPVSVKLRLAAMWTVIMFFYLYNDFFMLLRDMRHGTGLDPTPPGEATLLIYACIITPAALMPLLCLVMPPNLSRWANIVLGAAYFAIIVWTLLPPDTSWFYRFIGAVENLVTLLVIWTAWRWPREATTTA
jgi:hypothetical protein